MANEELEKAAILYEYEIGSRVSGRVITREAFKDGNDWTLKHDPVVLALVEALGKFVNSSIGFGHITLSRETFVTGNKALAQYRERIK